MADDYAPFPERELTALKGYHTQCARLWAPDSPMHVDHLERVRVCDNALASFAALRERCLLAETENSQLKRGNHAA